MLIHSQFFNRGIFRQPDGGFMPNLQNRKTLECIFQHGNNLLFYSSPSFSFFCLLTSSCLKLSPDITGLPVCASMSLRVLPATAPPSCAAYFNGSNPCESRSRCSLVVVASPNMVRINSISVMWSRRLSRSNPLTCLYSSTFRSNAPFMISFVSMANSRLSLAPCLSTHRSDPA